MSRTIQVKCYAGYRGDEYPQSFILSDGTHLVSDVIDRWYEPGEDIFKVKDQNRLIFILSHVLGSDEWRLRGAMREQN